MVIRTSFRLQSVRHKNLPLVFRTLLEFVRAQSFEIGNDDGVCCTQRGETDPFKVYGAGQGGVEASLGKFDAP